MRHQLTVEGITKWTFAADSTNAGTVAALTAAAFSLGWLKLLFNYLLRCPRKRLFVLKRVIPPQYVKRLALFGA